MSMERRTIVLLSLVTITIALCDLAGCGKVELINQGKLASAASSSTKTGSSTATTLKPVPGFSISGGGGITTGKGMVMYSTLGETGGGIIQRAPSMMAITGITGTTLTEY